MQTVALLFIGMSLFYLRKEASRKLEWERRVHTLAAVKITSAAQKVAASILSSETYERRYEDRNQFNEEMILMLNEFEQICLGIHQGIYDDNIVHSSLGRTFIAVFHVLKKFIFEHRSKANSIDLYVEFESAVRRWEAKSNYSEFEPRSRI